MLEPGGLARLISSEGITIFKGGKRRSAQWTPITDQKIFPGLKK
jgi:hypothetical protein